MTELRVCFIDVYLLRPARGGWQVLCLRRAPATRSAGTWETVHGHIIEGETPVEAALRELREETGLEPDRFYNLSRVDSFYLHRDDTVALIPAFVALVAPGAVPSLSAEHDTAEWLAPDDAARRFAWPREARALTDALALLSGGDAGGLEDTLRVR